MDARSLLRLAAAGCAVLLFTTGCLSYAPPENAVTWGVKAATDRLTETTPHEWQAVAEKIDQHTPEVDVCLTDEQAEAIVEFVQVNELDSIQDIVELVERAQSDLSTIEEIEIPQSVMDLFGNAEIDFEGALADVLGGAQS